MKNKFLNLYTFSIVVFVFYCSIILFNLFLPHEKLIYNFYSERFAQEQIEQYLENRKKWEWLTYAVIPIIIFIRASLVAMTLSIGTFIYYIGENTHPKFKDFFGVALRGEFVLVLVGFFKFFYFYFIKTDYTLLDLQQFYPLSYTNFLDLSKIQPWLVYPLQTVNLFEIGYFLVLVWGMWKLLQNNYWKSFEITAVSYGTGLLIWIGLVMFLILNLS